MNINYVFLWLFICLHWLQSRIPVKLKNVDRFQQDSAHKWLYYPQPDICLTSVYKLNINCRFIGWLLNITPDCVEFGWHYLLLVPNFYCKIMFNFITKERLSFIYFLKMRFRNIVQQISLVLLSANHKCSIFVP